MFSTLSKLLQNNSCASDTTVEYDVDNSEKTNSYDTPKAIINCSENQMVDKAVIKDGIPGSEDEKSIFRPHSSSLTYLTPVSRSGSVSLRSNSSSASTKSFAFPDSGSLTYLTPVSPSGSVSLRSNSSSACTQSFAFPV